MLKSIVLKTVSTVNSFDPEIIYPKGSHSLLTYPGIPNGSEQYQMLECGAHLQAETSCDGSLKQAKSWLEDCLANHRRCGEQRIDFKPSRLLQLKSSTLVGSNVRLRQPEVSDSGYACLSHCKSPLVSCPSQHHPMSS